MGVYVLVLSRDVVIHPEESLCVSYKLELLYLLFILNNNNA